MLKLLRQWFIQEKVLLTGIIQGRISPDVVRQLERFFRAYNISGNLRVVNHALAEFALEGPKPLLEKLILELAKNPAMSGQVMKIAWAEYTGKYHSFRVTL